MTPIPERSNTTAQAIVKWWGKKPQGNRPHLGASQIGKSCSRALWYSFRWAKTPAFEGRMLRLFDRGNLEETRFVDELRAIGVEVWDLDPDTNKQIRIEAVNGHFAGSCDGVAKGLPEAPKTAAVLEFKTHGDKSFTTLESKGVQAAKPEHYAQVQVYMKFLELDRALYLAVNKNTDALYSEWVKFDADAADRLVAKAEAIINATTPPERMSDDRDFFECRWCDFKDLCHGQAVAEVNCRTCCHASPVENASWRCENHNRIIAEKVQREACDDHIYIPPLIPFALPIDGGNGSITYQVKGADRTFTNSATPGHYKSREIRLLDPSLLGDKMIEDVKTIFGGEITAGNSIAEMPDDLEAVYAEDKSPAGKKAKKEIEKNKASIAALKEMKP
jgi:hypothetical protein